MLERRVVVAFAVALCILAVPLAAEEPVFRDLTLKSLQNLPSRGGAWEIPLPARFRALEVDVKALTSLLSQAPAEGSAAAAVPVLLALPYPDGTNQLFRIEESSIFEPALAARFPEIRTFVAQGIDDPTATARLSLTPLGFPCHGAVGVGHGDGGPLPPLGCALRPLLLQERRAQGGRTGLPVRRPG